MSNELFEKLMRRLGGVVLVAVTGDRLWVQRAGWDDNVVDIPLIEDVTPPALPPEHLPEHVREGLTTHRHLRETPSSRPVVVHGEIVSFEAFEKLCREAISGIQTRWWHPFFAPTVICTAALWDYPTRKYTLIESLKRAGCRQIFLVDPAISSAISIEMDLVITKAAGVLLVESDYTEFGVVGYADLLCHCATPFGCDDLLGPDDPHLDELALEISKTLEELRDVQLVPLAKAGIVLMGNGAAISWLAEAMAQRLGLTVRSHAAYPHPALVGLRKYAANLDDWVYTLETDVDSRQ